MMKLIKKIKIYSDGKHNAFTDMIYFKQKYYVCFRSGRAHMSPDGRAVILSSQNPVSPADWRVNKEFALEGDVRDTKFFVFKDALHLLLPVRIPDEKRRTICTYLTSSGDGNLWRNPVKIFKKNWVSWRPKPHNGKLYGAFYSYEENMMQWKVSLYVSSNAKTWTPVSTITSGFAPNETEIEFMNGKLYAWVRREGGNTLECVSSYPYKTWAEISLKGRLHAPVVQKVAGKTVLGVREFMPLDGVTEVQVADEIIQMRRQWQKLSLWERKKNAFKSALTLEEGENVDAGYLGLAAGEKNKKEAFVSYYLGSTSRADVYCAQIKVS